MFEGIDDVTPKLQSVKAEITEIDQVLNNLDQTNKRTSASQHDLSEKLTTFNERAVLSRIGITALTFATIRWLASAEQMAEKLPDLSGRLKDAKDNMDLARESLNNFKIEIGKVALELEGTFARVLGLVTSNMIQQREALDRLNQNYVEAYRRVFELHNLETSALTNARNKLSLLNATSDSERDLIAIEQERQTVLNNALILAQQEIEGKEKKGEVTVKERQELDALGNVYDRITEKIIENNKLKEEEIQKSKENKEAKEKEKEAVNSLAQGYDAMNRRIGGAQSLGGQVSARYSSFSTVGTPGGWTVTSDSMAPKQE